MKRTRICIIGGGSRQWAIQFMKDLSYNTMTHGELVLYDVDHGAALNNVTVAQRIFSVNDSEGRFIVSAEKQIETALVGCDLVVISIEPGSTVCRWGDLVLPEQYGILQSVGDTTGPGGIMRARRALPIFFALAEKIKAHCPNAWVINYTNPMTLCTAALYKVFPGIKALGCCHEVFHTQKFLSQKVNQWFSVPAPDRREITIDLTGVNHFTFVTKATWNGYDLIARLKEEVKNPATFADGTDAARKRLEHEQWFECDQKIAMAFLRDFGALGAAGDRHLAEFVPFFLSSDDHLFRYGVIRTPYEWRFQQAKAKREKIFTDGELKAERSDEEGVDIMRSLMGDGRMITNVNRPNEGQVSYLPMGRIVESNAVISEDAIRPIVSSDPPLAIQSMVRRVSDVQRMTLDAIYNKDDELLFAAFVSDPLMTLSLERARELFDKMLEASRLKY